jgi:hypothetical protein
MQKMVSDLVPGDMLDLEDDVIANGPCQWEKNNPGDICDDRDDDGKMITWKYEFAVVDQTEQETPDCIRVDFSNGQSIGFPPDHRVALAQVFA